MWIVINGLWIYKPEFFTLEEMLPSTMQAEIALLGDLLWLRFDARALITADRLRRRCGTALANTWGLSEKMRSLYGIHQFRGFRPLDCQIGSALSQHKEGRAVDLVFLSCPVQHLREDIITDPFHPDFEYITGLEMSVSWLHFDVRYWDKEKYGVFTFSP